MPSLETGWLFVVEKESMAPRTGQMIVHELYGDGVVHSISGSYYYIKFFKFPFPTQYTIASTWGSKIRGMSEEQCRKYSEQFEEERRREKAQLEEKRLKELAQLEERQKKELALLEEQRRRDAALYERKRLRENAREKLLWSLRSFLEWDFLNADSYFKSACTNYITRNKFKREKIKFVQSWFEKEGITIPDPQQATAIAATRGNIQVVARAGSGKTSTVVNRAFFLQKHCGVAPNEMLLLAFNNTAAKEMQKRLKELLGNAVPHAMTFHALAYAIVHPEESILHDDPRDENQGLSRVFQDVIDDHLAIPQFKSNIRDLMLAHFREDWERIIAGGYQLSKDELLKYRRSLPRVSLRGDYLKSSGEKVIADFLFEHGVSYKYERNHWWDNINYRPDFTIFKSSTSGVVIEYFGMTGDTDYDNMTEQKRAYWDNKPDWTLIEFGPKDISHSGVEKFRVVLKSALESRGITCNRLSDDEIWHQIRERAIDRFTKTVVGFVGRCRKHWLSPDDLAELMIHHKPLSQVEGMFLKTAHKLYVAYLERLKATGEDDFDGLMQQAALAIAGGHTIFKRKSGNGDLKKLRYIFIDEYQDFSELFYRLIEAVRGQNARAKFFCVGDDWQAINGFAGSDLVFYKEFSRYFNPSQRLLISTNYRSPQSIVETGNFLMDGQGEPAISNKQSGGSVILADLSEFEPTILERERHPGDVITPAVLRIVWDTLAAGNKVVLLNRRNDLNWFVNYSSQNAGSKAGIEGYLDILRSYFPKDKQKLLTISTAHKYKGLESQVVVVLDAINRSYPLIHPDWVFSNILGDSIDKIAEEERRLFYVALTRAVETLIIVTEQGSYSPFLYDILNKAPLNKVDWSKLQSVSGHSRRLLVKVSKKTYVIRELLTAEGYTWHKADEKFWAKSFPFDNFSVEILKNSLWARESNDIEVLIFDDHNVLVAKYLVDKGQWIKIVDKLVE